jgi:phosphoribosyl-AMP cyclohydrolase
MKKMRDALELVLLFHEGVFWSNEKSERWAKLSGNREATTRTLCDCAREALDGVTKE